MQKWHTAHRQMKKDTGLPKMMHSLEPASHKKGTVTQRVLRWGWETFSVLNLYRISEITKWVAPRCCMLRNQQKCWQSILRSLVQHPANAPGKATKIAKCLGPCHPHETTAAGMPFQQKVKYVEMFQHDNF